MVPGSHPPVELASLIFGNEFESCLKTAAPFCDHPFYGKLVSALCPVACGTCDSYCLNNNPLMEQLSVSLAQEDPPISWPAYCYAIDEDGFGDMESGSGSGETGFGYSMDDIKMDPIYMVACPAVSSKTGKPMSPKCVPGAYEIMDILGVTQWSHDAETPVLSRSAKMEDSADSKKFAAARSKQMVSHMRMSLFAYGNATRA